MLRTAYLFASYSLEGANSCVDGPANVRRIFRMNLLPFAAVWSSLISWESFVINLKMTQYWILGRQQVKSSRDNVVTTVLKHCTCTWRVHFVCAVQMSIYTRTSKHGSMALVVVHNSTMSDAETCRRKRLPCGSHPVRQSPCPCMAVTPLLHAVNTHKISVYTYEKQPLICIYPSWSLRHSISARLR